MRKTQSRDAFKPIARERNFLMDHEETRISQQNRNKIAPESVELVLLEQSGDLKIVQRAMLHD